MGCSQCKENLKRKTKNKVVREEVYVPKEDLQEIINSLIQRKEFLEKKLNIPQNQNNDNNITKMIYPEEYQKYIDQLLLDVGELEQKNSKKEIPNNSKILINFETMTGQISIVNVDKETKLRDAFKMAFSNSRYTISYDRETQFSDVYSKTSNSRERIDFEKLEFSFNGEIISEKFRNNELVSSLSNDLYSPITILVISLSKQNILKTNYNYYNQ